MDMLIQTLISAIIIYIFIKLAIRTEFKRRRPNLLQMKEIMTLLREGKEEEAAKLYIKYSSPKIFPW